MKNRLHKFKIMAYVVLTAFAITGCQNLDKPGFGEYELDPSIVNILSPEEGSAIKVFEEVTSVDIEIEVNDDNVVDEISIVLDGTEIATLNNFSNPRHVSETYTYDGLVNGSHKLTVTSTDINGKSTSAEVNFSKDPPYTPTYDGEILYMPFDGDYRDLVRGNLADQVGSPGFAGSGLAGTNAYKGAADSYLTKPTEGLLNSEFSATFWINTIATPDRAGILTISPEDAVNPGNPNNRSSGFRLFREAVDGNQVLKLNIGSGGDNWFDGGAAAALPLGEWAHVTISISASEATVFINGQIVSQGGFPGLDWTGCDLLSIGSGAPRFVEWGHLAEESPIDELRIFNKALTQADIQDMINTANPYIPQFPGETFYMPFDNGFVNLVGNIAATPVGSPQITVDAYEGSGAYMGATDSYITYPSAGLTTPEFSASMWFNLNNVPDRAALLAISPEDTANPGYPDIQNNRSSGIRLFREDVGGEQVLKLNIGTGGDNWFDGGAAAAMPLGEWAHLAISIGATEATVYINGVVVSTGPFPGLDWTGCDVISIMSGAPRFTEWGHLSDLSSLDELRFFNKALSAEEVGAIFGGVVTPPFFGATLYMPFDGDNVNKAQNVAATVVGTTGFSGEGKVGSDSFAGAADSYLTIPSDGLTTPEFSAAMWYKLNNVPDRGGILAISPEDVANAGYPDIQNDRSSGIRLFREDVGGEQVLKLNIGTGTDNWFDGGAAAAMPVGEWAHLAISIGATEATVYINGEVVSTGPFTGLDWTGCDVISIMSGAPRFTEWGHLSDLSFLDELYFFDKALTQAEIQTIMSE